MSVLRAAGVLGTAAALALAGCGASSSASPARTAADRACETHLGDIGVVDLQDVSPAGLAHIRAAADRMAAMATTLGAEAGASPTASAMRTAAADTRAFLVVNRVGAPAAGAGWDRLAAAYRALGQTADGAGVPQCRVASLQ